MVPASWKVPGRQQHRAPEALDQRPGRHRVERALDGGGVVAARGGHGLHHRRRGAGPRRRRRSPRVEKSMMRSPPGVEGAGRPACRCRRRRPTGSSGRPAASSLLQSKSAVGGAAGRGRRRGRAPRPASTVGAAPRPLPRPRRAGAAGCPAGAGAPWPSARPRSPARVRARRPCPRHRQLLPPARRRSRPSPSRIGPPGDCRFRAAVRQQQTRTDTPRVRQCGVIHRELLAKPGAIHTKRILPPPVPARPPLEEESPRSEGRPRDAHEQRVARGSGRGPSRR